jgi:hypothetical protein
MGWNRSRSDEHITCLTSGKKTFFVNNDNIMSMSMGKMFPHLIPVASTSSTEWNWAFILNTSSWHAALISDWSAVKIIESFATFGRTFVNVVLGGSVRGKRKLLQLLTTVGAIQLTRSAK